MRKSIRAINLIEKHCRGESQKRNKKCIFSWQELSKKEIYSIWAFWLLLPAVLSAFSLLAARPRASEVLVLFHIDFSFSRHSGGVPATKVEKNWDRVLDLEGLQWRKPTRLDPQVHNPFILAVQNTPIGCHGICASTFLNPLCLENQISSSC